MHYVPDRSPNNPINACENSRKFSFRYRIIQGKPEQPPPISIVKTHPPLKQGVFRLQGEGGGFYYGVWIFTIRKLHFLKSRRKNFRPP
eukprot:TRINITY_DN8657_c0_g1_i1.p1 TRINITY_DN8657_c0_g1~~TRINITY_DN8657_c0_g1_i1.p1  ORF type:complete len:88 (+),score=1.14 TRINITY_DN8657_c0_g1_i1:116-379(+)